MEWEDDSHRIPNGHLDSLTETPRCKEPPKSLMASMGQATIKAEMSGGCQRVRRAFRREMEEWKKWRMSHFVASDGQNSGEGTAESDRETNHSCLGLCHRVVGFVRLSILRRSKYCFGASGATSNRKLFWHWRAVPLTCRLRLSSVLSLQSCGCDIYRILLTLASRY